MAKILIADDEALIRRLVCDFLHKSGYETVEAENGSQALEAFLKEKPDLAVLDIMMPEKDGWEVCAEIRKTSAAPVVFLTARTQEFDELRGFEVGGDDYITKPFSPSILVKRIEALLKRCETSPAALSTDEKVTIGELTINIPAHEVLLNGDAVELTIKEYNILLKLSQNPDRTFSRDRLLDDIWGFDYSGDARTVDSHVAKLRTKLGSWGEKHLKTIYGIGYKIEVNRN